jgi:hypothetical protein
VEVLLLWLLLVLLLWLLVVLLLWLLVVVLVVIWSKSIGMVLQ